MGRYLLLGAVGVAALALVVVGVLALRGALSSKKPPHTSTPTTTSTPAAAQRSSPAPVLLIRIIREPCTVFVKDAANSDILQSEDTVEPLGAKLVFDQVPLQVQISDPHCADVYVRGRKQPPGAKPWIFAVPA